MLKIVNKALLLLQCSVVFLSYFNVSQISKDNQCIQVSNS